MDPFVVAAVVLGACVLASVATGLRVIKEYERGVVLRLGRRGPLLRPGLRLLLPLGIDRLVRVDLRSRPLSIPPCDVFTSDGVPIRVSATAHVQVVNALLALTRVADHRQSAVPVVQAALRDAIGRVGLRDVLINQDALRDAVGRFVDARTEPWGLRVSDVDLGDVELPMAMRRAMERQAELRGGDRAETLEAQPGLAATRRLTAAAAMLADQPEAVRMQFLEALSEASSEQSTVVVVPLPTELVQPFIDLKGRASMTRETERDVVEHGEQES